MYIHNRQFIDCWRPDWSPAGQRLQELYGIAPRRYFRMRYDEWLDQCFALEHEEDRTILNWHLKMYRAMSAMGGLGVRVKLQPRACKRPYEHKSSGKHKPFTRRTSRRLAKQYLHIHCMDDDFNHQYNPGIGYW